jgi:hypothetical protein
MRIEKSWGVTMSAMTRSYVCTVLFAKHPPSYGVGPGRWRWRRLTGSSRDRYQPELHYMRGPGPKWREKRERDQRSCRSIRAAVR